MAVLPLPPPLRQISTPVSQTHQQQQRQQRGGSPQQLQRRRNPEHSNVCHKASKQSPVLDTSQHKPPGIPSSLPHPHHHRNDLDANAFIRTLCKHGQLDMALDVLSHLHSPPLSTTTYLSLLQACIKRKTLTHASQVHSHLVQRRIDLAGLLGDYLVMTLAKCGALEDACHVSTTLPCRTVFSWTAIISAYAECDRSHEALRMYQCMQEDGVEPDRYTFVILFKVCGSIGNLSQGKKLHADACRKGFLFSSDVFAGNTLVSMYGKCGAVLEAENMFGALSQRTIVSWNAMLSAYVEQGQIGRTLQLYRQMQEEGMHPNQRTYVVVLQACVNLAEEEEANGVEKGSTKIRPLIIGQALHADTCKKGFAMDAFVGTALLSMYGKCGAIVEAEHAFVMLSQHDIVSWNAMLSVYVGQGQAQKALQLYVLMQDKGTSPDQQTVMFAIQACTAVAQKVPVMEGQSTIKLSLEIGQALHAYACKKDFALDVVFGTVLLSMYAKCGAIKEAEEVFDAMPQRDIVSWNAMLSAYIEHGKGEQALQLYREMRRDSVTLNDVTLLCFLQATSETGSLEILKDIHFDIVCTGYECFPSVAASLISAYGTCASMLDGQAVFDGLRELHIVPWTACIAGHAAEGNSVASLHMFEKLNLAGVKPDLVTFHSVLSACCHNGLVFKGLEYFESMSRDFRLNPDLKLYGIMIDLLGRAGDFKSIERMLCRMPMQADLNIWLCLLGACHTHGNSFLAKTAFNHAVDLQPKQGTSYVLMSNIYADAALWEFAAEGGS